MQIPIGVSIATTATRLPDGQTLRFAWNARGRLDEITLDHSPLTRHRWNEFAQEAQREQGELTTRYAYDPGGRLAAQTVWAQGRDCPLIDRDYDRDRVGRITAVHELRARITCYNYDPAGQLTGAQGVRPERFVHDPAGNLLEGEARVEGDRLLMQGDRHYRYDAAGNRIEERRGRGGEHVTHYEYDASHRLEAVHGPKGTTYYRYDALGRRIAKCTPEGETRFVWDGARMIGEAWAAAPSRAAPKPVAANDPASSTQRWYVYEPGSFRPLACIDRVPHRVAAGLSLVPPPGQTTCTRSEVYYYHLDHLGTPREMTDARGRIVWSARYRAWGALAVAEVCDIDNPLRFQGQYEDAETGLHYNLNRYYDPAIGRFINQDPIGLAGGLNVYAYAPNPSNWVDPLGLACAENDPGNTAGDGGPTLFSNRFHEDVADPSLVPALTKEQVLGMPKNILYVVKTDGSLVVAPKGNAQYGHIDLAGGQDVLAAGEGKILWGTVKSLDNASGHYLPTGPSAESAALDAFGNYGFTVPDSVYQEKVYDFTLKRWVPKND